MFTYDTECAKLIRNPQDNHNLQEDPDGLFELSAKWKLTFKESQCVLLRCSSIKAVLYTLGYPDPFGHNKLLGVRISEIVPDN